MGETMTIRELAAFKGWTIKELANRAGMKEQRLYDLMRTKGKPKLYAFELYALSKATGVPPRRIMY